MSKKIGDKTVIALIEISEKIKKLQETQATMIKKIADALGEESTGFIKLDEPDEKGYNYIRVKVLDNLEKFQSGLPVYRSSGFSRYSIEIDRLKNEPK